jgi:hypothetical protein
MKLFFSSLGGTQIPTPPVDVYGCTDPLATNYNPLATIDDGSCTYLTVGSFTFNVTFPINFA